MYLAVKRVKERGDLGLPFGYPYRCHQMQDDQECPRGYERMSIEELNTLKEKLAPDFKAYQERLLAEAEPLEEVRKKDFEDFERIKAIVEGPEKEAALAEKMKETTAIYDTMQLKLIERRAVR